MSRSRTNSTAYDPAVRCYLFYGPDEAASRDHANTVARGIGPNADKIDLSSAQLKADAALLPDAAAAGSLFAERQYVRVDGVGDECVAAVEALFALPSVLNPVILIAGALRKDARLVKLVESHGDSRVVASYVPEPHDLARLTERIALDAGVKLDQDMAAAIVSACGGDRAIVASEIAKLANYLDASIEAPKAASTDALDAIGADRAEADLGAVVDALAAADPRRLEQQLARADDVGQEAIALVRATLRRLLAMSAVRAEIDRGVAPRAAVDKVAKSLFWRDRDTVARDTPRWPAKRLAAAVAEVGKLERELKSSTGPGALALERLYHSIARAMRP